MNTWFIYPNHLLDPYPKHKICDIPHYTVNSFFYGWLHDPVSVFLWNSYDPCPATVLMLAMWVWLNLFFHSNSANHFLSFASSVPTNNSGHKLKIKKIKM